MSSFRDPFWTWDTKPKKKKHWLYRKCRKPAKFVKIFLQFAIGAGLVFLLMVKLYHTLFPPYYPSPRVAELLEIKTLELVANALEYSAGIELAFTLFTEGPDEAVE